MLCQTWPQIYLWQPEIQKIRISDIAATVINNPLRMNLPLEIVKKKKSPKSIKNTEDISPDAE